jgi:hypothetical protein
MSGWQFNRTGHKRAVIEELDRATFSDKKLAQVTQRYVTEMIEALPTDGVTVTMSGFDEPTSASVVLELQGINLILDPEERS